jgi:succinyl-diaminopimelate desuccinylase
MAISESLVSLLQGLVRIGSRAEIDPYDPIIDYVTEWLSTAGIETERILDSEVGMVGAFCEVRGSRPGPTLVLDATIDTVPFGDLDAWDYQPLSAEIDSGWLYGRGAADSKAGAAVFAHVAIEAAAMADRIAGQLFVVFECDEHSGRFGAARSFFGDRMKGQAIDGVMIGYPGLDRIVVGGRGFERFVVSMHGEAGHSGSSTPTEANAIVKAARLITGINVLDEKLQADTDPELGHPPRMTVTEVVGGKGFSTVPDLCVLKLDARLTYSFGANEARRALSELIESIDGADPARPSSIETLRGWPPFHTPADMPFVEALVTAAKRVLGDELALAIVGPSNVGNYLAQLGIPSIAGFGPRYQNIHGINEAVELATLEPVYRVYSDAVLSMLSVDDGD